MVCVSLMTTAAEVQSLEILESTFISLHYWTKLPVPVAAPSKA